MVANNAKRTKEINLERKAAPNQLYRRAILAALEDLKDHHSRSNLDLIRGRTCTILQDTGHGWNDLIFVQTLKSMSQSGDITLPPSQHHVWAELSPDYKRKRADSLSKKMDQDGTTPPLPSLASESHSPQIYDDQHHEKPTAVRKPELEKWKIMPKKLHDKTCVHIVNPMDTKT